MSPRSRYNLHVFLLWPVGGILIGGAALFVSPWFAPLLFVWALVLNYRARRIPCPSCGEYVDSIPNGRGGSLRSRRLFVGKTCEHCGASLS